MWRYNWRAFYRQWNCQVRSAQQSVCHEEERCDADHKPGHQRCQGALLLRRDVSQGHRRWERRRHHDNGDHGNGCEWAEWAQSFRRDFWEHLPPPSTLEAFGWGTCVMLGLHLNQLWRYVTHTDRTAGHNPGCLYMVVQNMPGSVRHIREATDSQTDSTASADTQVEQNKGSRSVLYDDTGWYELPHTSLHQHSFQGTSLAFTPSSIAFRDPLALQDRWPGKEMGPDSDAPPCVTDGNTELDNTEQSQEGLKDLYAICRTMIETGRGVAEAERGQYGKAVEAWRAASESVTSQFNLGVAHQTGRGVSVDLLQAAEHFQQGSLLGHSRSQYNLAMLYLEGDAGVPRDTRRAVRLLHKAARAGLAQAQTELGVLYTERERKDMRRAASWFQLAARQNDQDAQYYLGVCFENGWGVTEDKVKARRWYQLAAEVGQRDAMYNLGVFHEQGLGGLDVDVSRAQELYEQAAASGDEKAKSAIRRLSSQTLTAQTLTDFSHESGLQIRLRAPSLDRSHSSASSPTLTDYMRQSLANLDLDFDLDTHHDDLDSDIESTTSGSVRFSLGEDDDASDFSVQFDPDFENDHTGNRLSDFGDELQGMTGLTFGTHNELLAVPGLKHSHSAAELRALHF